MSNLYDLTGNYLDVYQQIASGEDSQIYKDTLLSINDSIEDKADQYAKVIRMLEADNEAITKEIKRLQAKKKSNTTGIENMKGHLKFSMEQTNKLAFKTATNSFGIQNNPPKVEITDEELIPKKYFIEQAPQLNKQILKQDMQDGQDIEGVQFVQTKSLRIR